MMQKLRDCIAYIGSIGNRSDINDRRKRTLAEVEALEQRLKLAEKALEAAKAVMYNTVWRDVCGEYVPTYPGIEMIMLFKALDEYESANET